MKLFTANRKKYIGMVSLVSFIFLQATGQSGETINEHALTAIISSRQISDEFLWLSSSPVSAKGLAYSFSSSTISRKKNIAVAWESGSFIINKEQFKLNEFNLQYTDVFSVLTNKHRRFNNYTGYSIAVNPQYIKRDDQYSWTTVNALSLYNSAIYYWNKSSLSFDVAIPIAGFSSRPVAGKVYKETVSGMIYNGFSNVNFTSLHNLKAALVSFQYQKNIMRKWVIKAGASFSYKELKAVYDFREQTYQLSAGISYHL